MGVYLNLNHSISGIPACRNRHPVGERFHEENDSWWENDCWWENVSWWATKSDYPASETQSNSRAGGNVKWKFIFHPQTNEENENVQENVSQTMGCFPWVFSFKPLKITFASLNQLLRVSLHVFIVFSNPPQNASQEENDPIPQNDSS